MDRSLRILHVDDDPDFVALTAAFLEREDDRFVVETEASATSALDRLLAESDAFDCVISDYQMPEMTGIEFLRAFRDGAPNAAVPFVLLTGKGSEEVAAEALNAGATSYVQKGTPDTYEYLAERIRRDVEHTQARRDSDRFGTLVRMLSDPVYVLDDDGRFTYVNEAFVDLVGYDRETILGAPPSLIKDAEAIATARRQLGNILSEDGPESATVELDVRTAAGEFIPCGDHMGILPYEGERFQGSVGVLRDISERVERERTLRRREDSYRTLVERTPIALYTARDGDLIYHNAAFASLFGRPAEANVLAGESLSSLVAPVDRERLRRALTQVEDGVVDEVRQPYVGVTTDEDRIEIELLGRGAELDGRPAVLGSVIDVNTDEAEYWELRRERDRLDEFTSIVSHDLRNPLNVAQGSVQWLRDGDRDADDTDEALARTADALDRMEELLADVLSLARQGQTVADREPVSIDTVAREAWRNVATREATLDVTAAGTAVADRSRLTGLFENLYRNSIEHGSTTSHSDARGNSVEHGSTSNRTRPADADGGRGGGQVTVRVGSLEDGFYVADDGLGIPAEDRDRVFDSGYTTAKTGTGFGLAIVAEIVEAHGWQADVTTADDGGARIEIRGGERQVSGRVDGPDSGADPGLDPDPDPDWGTSG